MTNPSPDPIPKGFATKLGVIVAAIAGVLGPLSTVLDGDQTAEALGALGVAAIALYKVLDGRYSQATAAIKAPVVYPTDPEVDALGEVPTEGELRNGFPEDAPSDHTPPDEFPDGAPDGPPEGAIGGKPGMPKQPKGF